jgi:hypothetical protein
MLQQVISRKEAKERGLKRYHGNCSKHGFVEYYTSNSACVVCERERIRNRPAEYEAWKSMIQRCTNRRHFKFPSYGGRGLEVYRPWRESFECFLQHIGQRPSPKHSLDRQNNEFGYFPGNVRWATASEQQRNRRKYKHRTKQSEQRLAA